MPLILARRSFLAGLGLVSLLGAPAVVKAASLMPVRGEPRRAVTLEYWNNVGGRWKFASETQFLTMAEAEIASPSAMTPGTYWWANPATGLPGGYTISKGSVIIPDGPMNMVIPDRYVFA